jgi:hypothetical protein
VAKLIQASFKARGCRADIVDCTRASAGSGGDAAAGTLAAAVNGALDLVRS